MCGISGYISNKNLISENGIKNTLSLMNRRGPDSQNFLKFDFSPKQIGLLHSRLDIIDLNRRSNQPFIEDNFVLIFNGEIYNYLEIRTNLEKKNYKFKTNSDTEVLMKSFIEYGENCVDHFVGMWAFAIWDNKKKNIFLSRDPFGEKPIYYFQNKSGFFFGSEIKFIQSLCNFDFKINKTTINNNLFLGYKSLNKTNQTFFNEIYSLESGTNLKIDLNLKRKKTKYWTPKINLDQNLSLEDAVNGVKEKIIKSLKLRMRSDVPLAFCLSGGIDSGLLASHAKKTLNKNVSTFSIIDQDERYNEEKNIRCVVNDLKCSSQFIEINKKQDLFLDRLMKLTNYHDGPIATLSYYIHSFLSESISRHNFKVAISGTGADELFTGYYDHYLLHLQSVYKTKHYEDSLNSWKKYILPNIRNAYLKNQNTYINNPNNRDLVYEKDLGILKYSFINNNQKFSEVNYCKDLLRKRMLNELFHEVVPVILKHDDLNSMYHSVENRSPYLDRELLEFSLKIPPHLLISDGFQKKVLRDSAKNVLTEKIRLDRQKKGFNASINSLLNLNNSEITNFIFDKKSPINEFINLEKFKKDLNIKEIPNHFSKLIFSIITTKFFLKDSL